jgi:hypothetical protein
MRIIAKLTRHRRENGQQFLAGRVEEPVELPTKCRLELRKSDLASDVYELIATSCTIPGVDPARARAANRGDQEAMGKDCIYF